MSDKSRLAKSFPVQFGIATLVILALCLIAAGLSAVGILSAGIVTFFVLCLFAIFILSTRLYLHPSPTARGIASSIEALSAIGLFGIVGGVYAFGHDGLTVLVGLAGGYCLCLIIVAPRLSAVASRSMPDFLCLRFGSEAVRFVALGIMTVTTVLFLAAQFSAAGLIASQGLGIGPVAGVIVGALGVLLLTAPAWQRGTSAPVVLAMIGIVGSLIAAYWLMSDKTGIPFPHLGYGGLFADVSAAEARLGLMPDFATPSSMIGLAGMLTLTFCLAIGAAVMPHSLMRVWTQGSPAQAEKALRVGLILFVLVATVLPGLAVLGRAELLGLFIDGKGMLPLDKLPAVLLVGSEICGEGAAKAVRDACLAKGFDSGIPIQELAVKPEAMLLATPALAGASDWMLGLLSMVALAVVIVAGSAASIALASAFRSRAPDNDAVQEIWLVSALVVIAAAAFAAATGLDVITLGAWTYSLVGASLFCPLVLSLHWEGMSSKGAVAGMFGGFLVTGAYIFGAHWGFDFAPSTGDEWSWFGMPAMMAGIFGISVSLALSMIVSSVTAKASAAQTAFLKVADRPKAIANPEVQE